MRRANFRDDVLWALAYKIGADPRVDFQANQTASLSSFINQWIRRTYDSADFPEWTLIRPFTPTAGHMVLADQFPNDFDPDTETTGQVMIGRVLKVYLVDPDTVPGAGDTPYRKRGTGIFVVDAHGPSVWIKYLPRFPRVTSDKWDGARSYNLEELAYSPRSGECYKSRSSGNIGHDPSIGSERHPLPPEQTQFFTPYNPGLPPRTKIVLVSLLSSQPGPDSTDPPAANSTFELDVFDVDGNNLGSAVTVADGVETLADVVTDLVSQLVSSLGGGWTVTADTANKTFTLENASDFVVAHAAWFPVIGYPVSLLKVVQIRAYFPGMAAAAATRQVQTVTLSDSQVLPFAVYSLSFLDSSGATHSVEYTALSTDSGSQILAGLIAAMEAAQATDTFFEDVQSTLNPDSPILSLSTGQQVSLDAGFTPPSQYWELVEFPLELVDSVVRGTYADWLKEAGQPDKAGPEEQLVPQEVGLRTTAQSAPQYDPLTDQQGAKSRYGR